MRTVLIIEHTELGILNSNNPSTTRKKRFASICQLQKREKRKKKKKRKKETLLWRPIQLTGIASIVETGQGCCITLVFFGDFVAAYPSVIGQIHHKVRALLIQTLNNRANVFLREPTVTSVFILSNALK